MMLWKMVATVVFIMLNLPSPGVESTTSLVPYLFGRAQTAMRGALHTVKVDLKMSEGARGTGVLHREDIAATTIAFFRNAAFAQSSRPRHAFGDQLIGLVQFCFHEKASEKFQMGGQRIVDPIRLGETEARQ
jgi:hypothetical protein